MVCCVAIMSFDKPSGDLYLFDCNLIKLADAGIFANKEVLEVKTE